MTSRPSQFLRSRRIASGLLATVALLAACESQLPTAAELQNMDVKGVETRIAQVTKLDTTRGALPAGVLNGAPARVVEVSGSAKKPFTGILIVDGKTVESSSLNSISPESIESIEVMKGEAAKALYGEAGANGVIKVTTKKK